MKIDIKTDISGINPGNCFYNMSNVTISNAYIKYIRQMICTQPYNLKNVQFKYIFKNYNI